MHPMQQGVAFCPFRIVELCVYRKRQQQECRIVVCENINNGRNKTIYRMLVLQAMHQIILFYLLYFIDKNNLFKLQVGLRFRAAVHVPVVFLSPADDDQDDEIFPKSF